MEMSTIVVLLLCGFLAWKIFSVINSIIFRVLGVIGAIIALWRLMTLMQLS
ncbi:MAG: hypothetical protein R3250_03340 [Melioribacteraceae bacterium]|nr:hypothetical protein [Melioribacteraceae bacterium]